MRLGNVVSLFLVPYLLINGLIYTYVIEFYDFLWDLSDYIYYSDLVTYAINGNFDLNGFISFIVFLDNKWYERDENYLFLNLLFSFVINSFYFSRKDSKKLGFLVGVLSNILELFIGIPSSYFITSNNYIGLILIVFYRVKVFSKGSVGTSFAKRYGAIT